jgi:putative SOS response-associated peptidase YedK
MVLSLRTRGTISGLFSRARRVHEIGAYPASFTAETDAEVLKHVELIPWFSKDGKLSFSTINARAEGLRTAASYKEPFAKGRRCLVPASGYFEWTGPKNDRQPHYFTRADGQPMALAGLWDRWRSKDKSETKETFTIVTTEPSKFVAQFHNRMPLVLEPNTWEAWLRGDPDTAASLLKPANEDLLVGRPVSKAIGNVKNNSPDLLEETMVG